ncbi:MAG: adenylate/guanylate cyclase domain-containing protein [Polyangiaceae bacterium]|nr:adenylate/guanylate cyclase domain-containing protein [Polyangiaceae bacterium]
MKSPLRHARLFARGEVHLHLALTTLFVVLLCTSSIAALSYTYVRMSTAARRSAWQTMRATNRGVYRDVLRYLGQAKRTTAAVAWAVRDLSTIHDNEDRISSVLIGQVRAQREVFSVAVGDASGSLLMVGKTFDEPTYRLNRAKALPPEVEYRIHRADLLSNPKAEYYRYLNVDMTAVDQETVPADSVQYDARTRRWYREAEQKRANSWTDVALFRNGEFAISNVEPILGPDGSVRMVVSSSIALSLRDGITSRLNVAQHGIACVVDADGQLIIHPDRRKITRCPQAGQCRFNKVHEIGDPALAQAFRLYKQKSDLTRPVNTPRWLNYQDYSAAVGRLAPRLRAAFDRLYRIDEQSRTIRLRDDLSADARRSLPEILAAIRYTYNVRFTSRGAEYMASFHAFPERYGKRWLVGTLVPSDDFVGRLKSTLTQVALISVGIMILAAVIIVLVSRRILRPLALISHDMGRIQRLDIDVSVRHTSFFYEIDRIGSALDSMKHGLKAFSKFVPVTLVKQLIVSKTGAELGGEKRRLTMMFTDIEGFTSIAESMQTEALLQHISEYLDSLTTIILGQSGTVDKYIGDAIMSFWGAPIADPDHEAHACRAALLCVRELNTRNAKWASEGKPELRTRFGISSGEVSVGNMGSRERMNYTVLGDAVNLASRLEGINKYYGTRIIVGEDTYEVVKTRFLMRPVDVVAVKGKAKGVRIYELLAGLSGDPDVPASGEQLRCKELTEQAFQAYIGRDFQRAASLYQRLAGSFPDDGVGPLFVQRCEAYMRDPPGPDWTGITRMTRK